jgi:hypothetical protein
LGSTSRRSVTKAVSARVLTAKEQSYRWYDSELKTLTQVFL